jgi:hypothetical protein
VKFALLVVLVACGKKPDAQPTPMPEPAASEFPPEVAKWAVKDASKAWQGAWITSLALGDPLATPEPAVLDIQGDGAKGFDGTQEYPLGFQILAPCMANFEQVTTEKDAITASTRKYFVIDKGTLIAADSGVGMRKGKTAIVCEIDVVTLDDKGVCKTWSVLDNWKSSPTECAWKQTEDGKDVLAVGKYAEYLADGDVLMSMPAKLQLEHKSHTKQPSYEAAKQALPKRP